MELYGYLGWTHAGGRIITVMSPEGASAVCAHIDAGDDFYVLAGPGRLAQYQVRRAGALERLIETYGIVVLDKAAWDAKKAELGEAVWG